MKLLPVKHPLVPRGSEWILLFIVVLVLSKCNPVVQIEDFDSGSWKQDRLGCQGIRLNQEETLWLNREQLMDISENQIIQLLGKPNHTELYVRNQKFLVYYVGASKDCANGSKMPRSLLIRFDALNYSNEISMRN